MYMVKISLKYQQVNIPSAVGESLKVATYTGEKLSDALAAYAAALKEAGQ